jgi:hypothetical protein
MGHFKTSWTPPTNDLYTIKATFDGTKSYFASAAETSIAVQSANVDSSASSLTLNDSFAMYLAIATAVIIIAIAIAAIFIKRK